MSSSSLSMGPGALPFAALKVVVVVVDTSLCRIASHGRGHVVLLMRLWSWLCTGCARIMVVNKMSKNLNQVNT